MLYIQKSARNTWSQEDTWHVPPLPGPSQGNLKPNEALSGINLELLAYRTPFKRIKQLHESGKHEYDGSSNLRYQEGLPS